MEKHHLLDTGDKAMEVPKLVTEYWAKPIPTDQYDWSAVTVDYEPGCPIGYGATEQAAIDNLLEKLV